MSDIPLGIILSVAQLGWTTLQNTLQACGAHDELRREVRNLHGVLQLIDREAKSASNSLLKRCDDDQEREMKRLIRGCERIRRTLDEVVHTYNGLTGRKGSFTKFLQRVRFGNGEMLDLTKMRVGLGTHMHALTLWFHVVSGGSQGRIESSQERVENHIQDHGKELQSMRRELRGIVSEVHWGVASMQARDREGSVMTSYTNDDTAVWRSFRREMIKEKVNSVVLEQNMPLIKRYIKELGNEGALDDITENDDLDEENSFVDDSQTICLHDDDSDGDSGDNSEEADLRRDDSEEDDPKDNKPADYGERLIEDDTPPSINLDPEGIQDPQTALPKAEASSFKAAYVEDAVETPSAIDVKINSNLADLPSEDTLEPIQATDTQQHICQPDEFPIVSDRSLVLYANPRPRYSYKGIPRVRAEISDAMKHKIDPSCCLSSWDPSEEPLRLMGCILDMESFFDWVSQTTAKLLLFGFSQGMGSIRDVAKQRSLVMKFRCNFRQAREAIMNPLYETNPSLLTYIRKTASLLQSMREAIAFAEQWSMELSYRRHSDDVSSDSGSYVFIAGPKYNMKPWTAKKLEDLGWRTKFDILNTIRNFERRRIDQPKGPSLADWYWLEHSFDELNTMFQNHCLVTAQLAKLAAKGAANFSSPSAGAGAEGSNTSTAKNTAVNGSASTHSPLSQRSAQTARLPDEVPELTIRTPNPYSRVSQRAAEKMMPPASPPTPYDENYLNNFYANFGTCLNGASSPSLTQNMSRDIFQPFPDALTSPQPSDSSKRPAQSSAYQHLFTNTSSPSVSPWQQFRDTAPDRPLWSSIDVPSLPHSADGALNVKVPWLSRLITRMRDPIHIDELRTTLRAGGCTEDDLSKAALKLRLVAEDRYPNGVKILYRMEEKKKLDRKGKTVATTRKLSWWEPNAPSDLTVGLSRKSGKKKGK